MTLIAVLVAFAHWRDPAARLPLTIVLASWLTILVKRQLNLRFFLAAVSALFLLVGYVAARDGRPLFERFKARGAGWAFSLLAAVLLVTSAAYLGASVVSLPFLAEVTYEVSDDSTTIQSWITDVVPPDTPVFLVNGWDHFSTPALNFLLCTQQWPAWEGPAATAVFLVDPERYPEAVTQFRDDLFAASPSYVVHLDNTPVPDAGGWWAYRAAMAPCMPDDWQASHAFSFRLWDDQLEREIIDHPFRYATAENRARAREDKRYALQMVVRGTICRPPN
jgi:hypothetical protein